MEARAVYSANVDAGTATARTYWLLAKLDYEAHRDESGYRILYLGLSYFESDRDMLALKAERALGGQFKVDRS